MMERLSFVNASEIGPIEGQFEKLVAMQLNMRFAGFLAALARKRELNLPRLLEDSRQILEDANIEQAGTAWWRELDNHVIALNRASRKYEEHPCEFNMKELQRAIKNIYNWFLFS